LQRVFQEQGVSVSGWIRSRRLDRCRRDLADPGLAQQPIWQIAARHGFPNASHFSRLFRTVHGESPGDWRAARCAGRQRPGANG
jgi:AraC-like DNA-binding protein